MAIKNLMLRRKIEAAKEEQNNLRAEAEKLKTREDEILDSIDEATTQEQKDAVDAEIEKLNAEQEENDKKTSEIERTISELEKELAEEEARASSRIDKKEERKERTKMTNIKRRFKDFSLEERSDFVQREEVRDFLKKVREIRSIGGTSVLIPDTMVELLREEISANSKLISKVNKKNVKGTARQPVLGKNPEGIWVEATAALNELSLSFSQVKVDGYKVGGYIPVANSILEDSDIALANEIITALGAAIGSAVDKAIVYGTGTGMPLGIMTRLAQTEKPAAYPADAPAWVDLHAANISKFASASLTGEAFFKKLGGVFASATAKYAKSDAVWLMNHKTAITVKTFGINFNAAGAIVSGVNGQMPVFGGEIIELDFVPDNDIIAGYLENYLVAERSGTSVEASEHAQFIQDNTIFKGTARYDGQPAVADAFAACNIGNVDVATTGFYAG